MKHDMSVDGEAMSVVEGRQVHKAPSYQMRSDPWIEPGVDVTHLVGSGPHLRGPDRAAADEAIIRAYLDALHRNNANGSIENADALVCARDALAVALGLVVA